MQTKQQQKDEFEKEFSKDDSFPRVEDITAFWLQKQDQLLTELGEAVEKEMLKGADDAAELARQIDYNEGLDTAIYIIKNFKS